MTNRRRANAVLTKSVLAWMFIFIFQFLPQNAFCKINDFSFYASFDQNFTPDKSQGAGTVRRLGPEATFFVEGVKGSAVVVERRATLNYPVENNLRLDKGTISMWAKPIGWSGKDASNSAFFHARGMRKDEPDDWIRLEMWKSGVIQFIGGQTGKFGSIHVPVPEWEEGEWKHIAGVWENGKAALYINGRKEGETTWPIIPKDVGKEFRIGGYLWDESPGQVAVDELYIYPFALSHQEVMERYLVDLGKSREEAKKEAKKEFERRVLYEKQREYLFSYKEEKNIAKTEAGAKVIASDQSRNAELTAVLEKTEQAYWESLSTSGDKWLELHWNFPQEVAEVVFFNIGEPTCRQYNIEAYSFEKEQWRVIAEGSLEPDGFYHHKVGEITTNKVRLNFPESKGGVLRISNVRVISSKQVPEEPNWQAKWIWAPASHSRVYPALVYLRKKFDVPNPSKLVSAFVQSSVDDGYTMYLNGKLVGGGEGRPPMVHNIKDHLHEGENVVAVRVFHQGGACGFLSEIYLNWVDGGDAKSVTIPTDESWLHTLSLPSTDASSWTTSKLDDSSWEAAYVVAGSPPDGPWGAIAYQPFALNPDTIHLSSIPDFSKQRLNPGTWLEGDLRLTSQRSLLHDYALKFMVEMPYPVGTNKDLRLIEANIWPEVPTSEWEPGKEYHLPYRLWIPGWAPHGTFNVSVQAVGKGASCPIVSNIAEKRTDEAGIFHFDQLAVHRFEQTAKQEAFVHPEIRARGDRPTLFLDGEPYPPIIFTLGNYGLKALSAYAQTGVHLYRVHGIGRPLTVPENADEVFSKYVEVLEANIDLVLRNDPEARFLVLVMLRTDSHWLRRYPDELTVEGDGGRKSHHSIASEQWRRDSAAFLHRLVEYVDSQEWGKRVFGYIFGAGGGGEFQSWGWRPEMVAREVLLVGDHSPSARESFRFYLREKYGDSVSKLRTAWDRPDITFENAWPDNERLVEKAAVGFFHNPVEYQDVLDYCDWYGHIHAESFILFSRTVKESSSRNLLCGGWFGYSHSLNPQRPSMGMVAAHAHLDKVIDSPHVDFIVIPYSYGHRRGGEAFNQNSPLHAVHLRGKLFLAEYDNRTFASGLRVYSQLSLEESVQIQRRDIAGGLSQGAGWWYVDFARGEIGQKSVPWYDHPYLLRDIRRSVDLYKLQQKRGFENVSEIAVLIDPRGPRYLDAYANVLTYNAGFRTLMNETPAIGAPVDYLLIDDILIPEVQNRYKVYIFLNSYVLSSEQRRVIREKLQTAGKTLVWLWAPGYAGEGDRLDVAAMSEITGMRFEMEKGWQESTILLEGRSSLARGEPQNTLLKTEDFHGSYFRNRPFYEKRIAPLFWPIDRNIEVAGRYGFNRKPGLAVKRFKDWTSIFCGIPYLPASVLRNIAREAGAHIYFDEAIASLQASGDFITIHNLDRETKGTIHLPRRVNVFDAMTGELLKPAAASFDVKMQPGETLFLLTSEVGR